LGRQFRQVGAANANDNARVLKVRLDDRLTFKTIIKRTKCTVVDEK